MSIVLPQLLVPSWAEELLILRACKDKEEVSGRKSLGAMPNTVQLEVCRVM